MATMEKKIYQVTEKEEEGKKKKRLRKRKKAIEPQNGSSSDSGDVKDDRKSVTRPVRENNDGDFDILGRELYELISNKKNKQTLDTKMMTREALGEARHLKNKARKERMKQKKLAELKRKTLELREKQKKEAADLLRSWKKKENKFSSDTSAEDGNSVANSENEPKITVKAVDIKVDNEQSEEEHRMKLVEKRRRRRLRRAQKKSLEECDENSKVLHPTILAELLKEPDVRKKELLKEQIVAASEQQCENELKKVYSMPLSVRAKIYQEHVQKKEQMNLAIDEFYKSLKTAEGKPVRMILLDDSKFSTSSSTEDETSWKMIDTEDIPIAETKNDDASSALAKPLQVANEGQPVRYHWEDRLKKRIKDDRVQLDKLLLELKQKIEERNRRKKLEKERKKLKKEKMKDRKMMIKLLKERINKENKNVDSYGKRNILLSLKEDSIDSFPKEENIILSGSKLVLNNPVKDLLMRLISRSERGPKEEFVAQDQEEEDENEPDKEIEEIGDHLEEMVLRKISKVQKRKEGKTNRKKERSSSSLSSEPSPRKEELRLLSQMQVVDEPMVDPKTLWNEAKALRKKERKNQLLENELKTDKNAKRKPPNEKLMHLWREMIRRNTVHRKSSEYLDKKLADLETEETLSSLKRMDEHEFSEISLNGNSDNEVKIERETIKMGEFLKPPNSEAPTKAKSTKRGLKLPPLRLKKDLKTSKNIFDPLPGIIPTVDSTSL